MTDTLIGSSKSRAFRPLWLLEELGVPYEHVPARPRDAAVTRHNPSGKVPVLLTGGVALTDSTAIMTHLADRHGGCTHPPGTLERARQDAATQMVLDEMDAVLWTAAKHSMVLPLPLRVPAIKETLRWEFGRAAKALGEVLGKRRFLAGDALTLADIVAAHCLDWAAVAKLDWESKPLAAFHRRMRARPAYKRARERE